jgi:DNA (cytosine-5)-methyltransferase 1
MKYLSVCSGIEAATVAWHQLGWKPVGFAEIEPFPAAVLAHNYPAVKNLGDMTNYKEWDIGTVDLLVGGTPCQSFSVAGLRKGLADPRGNLALVYCGILDHFRPQWCVWENVPGVLSSNGGRDFGSFLRALAELGYGFAYRVLDAQYFGVAQRRRRVFVVGHLGDWRAAAEVLFEPESLRRDPAPSREAGQKPAASLVPSVAGSLNTECGGGKLTHQSVANGHLIGTITAQMFQSLGARDVEEGAVMPATKPIALADISSRDKSQNGSGWKDDGTMYTLDTTGLQGVAQPIPLNTMNVMRSPDAAASTGCGVGEEGEAMFTITKANHHAVAQPITQYGEIAGSLTARHDSSPCADRGQNVLAQPIAFTQNQRDEVRELQVAGALAAEPGMKQQTYLAQPITFGAQMSNPQTDVDMVQTLQAKNPMAVAQPVNIYGGNKRPDRPEGGFYVRMNEDTSKTLDAASGLNPTCSQGGTAVMQSMAVRRLTPVECERLQGFPDNYTNIPWRKQPESPDGPRYKALGNSMAVPVMGWIGKRIQNFINLQSK